MEQLYIVVIFFFVVSLVLFILGHINKRNDDAGNASKYFSLGIVMIIISVLLFIIMVNVNHLYEDKEETPTKIIYINNSLV